MTSQQIREWAAAGVLAGALGVGGCGSGDDAGTTTTTTTSATATQTAAAELPDGLRGGWRRTLREDDWKPAGGGFPTGRWRVDVDRRGEASVYQPGMAAVDFSTRFMVKGRELTIASVPVCPGQTGRYAWRASGHTLTLSVVADACKPRAALFGGTWTSRAPDR
jgi:hypothetical protein